MYYSKFSISEYKGINEVTLDLVHKSGVVTLVGLNESGKTTILEAIHTFFNLVKENQELHEKDFETIIPRAKIASFTGKTNITATIAIEEEDDLPITRAHKEIRVCVEIIFHKGKYKNDTIHIKAAGGRSLDISDEQELKSRIIESLPNIYFYDDFLGKIPDSISYCQVQYSAGNTSQKGPYPYSSDLTWGKILNEVFTGANPDEDFFSVISEFDFKQNEKSIDGKIAKMGKYLTDEISNSWKELTGSNYRFKEIFIKDERTDNTVGTNLPAFPEIDQIVRDVVHKQESAQQKIPHITWARVKQITIHLKVKNKDDSEFDIEERSKGCRWFFSFLLFTYFRKSNNCLFLLDEPGSNLHGLIQESICNKAFDELSKSCCVIYSTHSPYLINMQYQEYVYIVSNTQESENDDTSMIEINKWSEFISNSRAHRKDHVKILLDHVAFNLPSILDGKTKYKEFSEKSNKDIKDRLKKWFKENKRIFPEWLYKLVMLCFASTS